MAIDNSFVTRQIRSRESMIVAFCAFTNMPFVVCDPITYNDQVWIFENEALLQEFSKRYTAKKVMLRGVKFLNKDFIGFFTSLFMLDVNELVFVNESATLHVDLDRLVNPPDFSKLKPEQRPVTNPSLQLTGLYLAQEARRPVPADEKDEDLKDLNEEFNANLMRARYILAIEPNKGPGDLQEKIKNQQFRLPVVRTKDGSQYQVAFTDPSEFSKYARGKKLTTIAAPFLLLGRLLAPGSKGYILNPQGFSLVIPREFLERVQQSMANSPLNASGAKPQPEE